MDLLDKMATYVRVIEAGSLSAAGRQLRISAAAVSRQIATLETQLGTPLILRTTRRMTITDAGRRYYEQCLRVLHEVDDAQAIGRGLGMKGPLKINAPVSFGLAFVAPRMPAFLAAHPTVRVDLRLEDRRIDLQLDDVDVAIRVGMAPPESTEIVAHELTSYRRLLVASPTYLSRRGEPRTLEALGKHCALTHAIDPGTWIFEREGREVRAPIQGVFRSTAFQALREMALHDMGIAYLPRWFVEDDLSRRALRVVMPDWHSVLINANAIHRRTHRGEVRVRALIDHLRAA